MNNLFRKKVVYLCETHELYSAWCYCDGEYTSQIRDEVVHHRCVEEGYEMFYTVYLRKVDGLDRALKDFDSSSAALDYMREIAAHFEATNP